MKKEVDQLSNPAEHDMERNGHLKPGHQYFPKTPC